MRPHDWTGFAALFAGIAAVVSLLTGGVTWTTGAFLIVAAVTAALTRHWSLTRPGPMPHLLRWTLIMPRGSHGPKHLLGILEPQSGERVLEIGPGIGVHSIPVAGALASGGRLDVLDAQQAMLHDVMKRAAAAGVANIEPQHGDARTLPYADATFDAAYLIGVLGEIPDGDIALRELHRVLKPAARLVVGEVIFDPDYVSLGNLRERLGRAGFVFERKLGSPLTYLARFRRA